MRFMNYYFLSSILIIDIKLILTHEIQLIIGKLTILGLC